MMYWVWSFNEIHSHDILTNWIDAEQLHETYTSDAFFYYSREDVNLLLSSKVQRIDQVSTLIHKSIFLIRYPNIYINKINIYQIQFISYFNFRPWNISESGTIPNLHSARTLFVNSFVTITLNGRHFPTISMK